MHFGNMWLFFFFFLIFKSPFRDQNMHANLWHSSVDLHKISLFPTFQSILRLHRSLCKVLNACQNNKSTNRWLFFNTETKKKWICKKYFAHKHYVHDVPKGFLWCKNLNIKEKIEWIRMWISKWTFKYFYKSYSQIKCSVWISKGGRVKTKIKHAQ